MRRTLPQLLAAVCAALAACASAPRGPAAQSSAAGANSAPAVPHDAAAEPQRAGVEPPPLPPPAAGPAPAAPAVHAGTHAAAGASAGSPEPRAAAACAPYPSSPGEQLLSSGGELDLSCLPPGTIENRGASLVAWGLTEVPGGSRLQAALALADAAARAELVASVRVGIASLFRSAEADDRVSAEKLTVQVASGLLPALEPARHGWRRVRRGSEEVLVIAARISADRAALQASMAKALAGRDAPDAMAQRALEAMGGGRPLERKAAGR